MTHSFTKGVPIDTDGTLSLNSNQVVPSQAAVVTYVTNSVAAALASATDLHTAKLIVNPSGGAAGGNYTTIAAALTAAASGDTIFITPGTYTEDLTLKAGVNLTAFGCDSGITDSSNVIILGKCTLTTAGTVNIYGVQLKTNSDFFLAVTGSVASVVNLNNCYLNCSNNTGITYTSSSASSGINLISCRTDLVTTGITLFVGTGAGNINFRVCNILNTGNSTTTSSMSSGNITLNNCYIAIPITTTSTSVVAGGNNSFSTNAINVACLTANGGAGHTMDNSFFASGTASAISIGAGASISLTLCTVNSTNTNAITGAGTINYSDIVMSGSSSTINTTTKTAVYVHLGKWRATGQPAFLATANLQSNVTGNGTSYTVIFANEIFDQDNNFDGTSTFTAPVTGRYQFNVTIEFADLGAANTSGSINIVATSRTVQIAGCNWGNLRNVANAARAVGSVLLDMTAGNTCTVTVAIAGGTKIVDVVANNSTFSGFLVA